MIIKEYNGKTNSGGCKWGKQDAYFKTWEKGLLETTEMTRTEWIADVSSASGAKGKHRWANGGSKKAPVHFTNREKKGEPESWGISDLVEEAREDDGCGARRGGFKPTKTKRS